MEMWLKQSILMLLTAAAAVMAKLDRTIYLNKTQERVNVSSGDTLALHCCLSTPGQRYRIGWYFNNSGPFVNNTSKIFDSMISEQTSKTDCKDSNKTYILSNVSIKNSGWYFCVIIQEIPRLNQFQSEGTEVVVSDSEVTTYPSNVTNIKDPAVLSGNWWLWIVLGVSSFILLVLLVICVLLTRRQEDRDEPIYANTRYPNKQPSPRPDTSRAAVRLKTASSSQNLRTPSPARYDEGKRRDNR